MSMAFVGADVQRLMQRHDREEENGQRHKHFE